MSSQRRGSTPLSVAALCGALVTLSALTTLCGVGARPPAVRRIGRPGTLLEFQQDLECGGKFDRVLIARLTVVCQDCMNLYQEPELFGLCRQQCFTSRFFGGCLQALQIIEPDEVEQMHATARILKG